MTLYAVSAEFGETFVELRPRVQFGPACRCEAPGCTVPATLVLEPPDAHTKAQSRLTCIGHVDESLHLIGLVTEGVVRIRRLPR